MNLLSNFFKKKYNISSKKINIFAPISGKIVDLKSVPDDVFSKKIVGDGIAIQPTGKRIVAPIKGIIGKIFNTMHAFSIISSEKIEMFVHFGIDTILLNGKGFKKIAQDNQKVNIGDVILEYDLDFLKEKAKSILTPIIISNIEKIKKIKKYSGVVHSGKTPIMQITI
ncbi:PTS glucose transporter subunit IIA [Buchnera aphidicola]|uniref:PTS system glucose-specific EIIA component n=1 Tax=Buchnera aphidicola (Sarucallis kahawaluokalani) TaxID=1241878 RepID=A0A4D6YIN4_9GAMM|nr:PTS glucose transporter subunit IIA [Buchnera aphidicola]QCI25854.1 PTS glucose transporter subunit IIA [Buchnera aphidicola (Sarucallis kahawaluokalani)]